ncbi:dipeptidyl peptidase 3-like [Diadema antillarum]|uniref:dipeptidyl peptidase 3-like n=1 Tax=Diadema antillarum TaxID=105358 RepID=UPI003A890372
MSVFPRNLFIRLELTSTLRRSSVTPQVKRLFSGCRLISNADTSGERECDGGVRRWYSSFCNTCSRSDSSIIKRSKNFYYTMANSQFIIPNDVPFVNLACKTAFEGLTSKEKKYAHFIAKASWSGGLVCLFQTSPESPLIFLLLQKIFKSQPLDQLKNSALGKGLTEDEFQSFMTYAAAFYSNMGNYKSFGDTKFIPELAEARFEAVVQASKAYEANPKGVQQQWDQVKAAMYSLEKREQQLGLGDEGVTTYFSDNCTLEDAEMAKKFMTEKNISAYNTRLMKTLDDNKKVTYEIRLASSLATADGGDCDIEFGSFDFEGVTFSVTRGDYGPLMAGVVDNLRKAGEWAANENERAMMENYVKSFSNGSIDAHKEGSRYWIKDKGPIVETYIGFIESYRDPFGSRGEWEGFVAMVNKEMSAKFATLVASAEELLPQLPWPKEYEKDKFLRPDFTSLDILSYASSGIPAGINIPNYDDIRQDDGYKNVSLGNVLSAYGKEEKVTFLTDEDKEYYKKLKGPSFEVQVGLHELLGHGSGKLFKEDDKGNFNFDRDTVRHTETGEKISTWYKHGEVWDSKFPVIASPYEECRAECVGLYLCISRDALKIFGHEGQMADDIIYVNWLNMVRAGILGLEFYTPETKTWRQAHMQARYVILRVLLEAGEGLVKVTRTTGEDGKDDVVIQIDRTKIETVGKEAIGTFLRKLQVYKSLGDFETGKAFFNGYSVVDDSTPEKFLSLRQVVLDRKQPRRIFVQCNTFVGSDGEVVLTEYDQSATGVVQSFVERFPDEEVERAIRALWEKDRAHFPSIQ